MELRPRHFVLFAIVIALFVFNIVRYRRQHHAQLVAMQQGSSEAASAWIAFDRAAALRDAPEPQFLSAFNKLRIASEDPSQTGPAITDVRGCKTWLLFYRQPQWRANAQKHVDGCVHYHRDAIQ